MIVKNEEENLSRLLSSVKDLADEIIVVDTGSVDGTIEIARTFGAQVFRFEWCDDFSAARNESLRHATKDFIFWLDGDDELPAGELPKIRDDLRRHKDRGFYLRLRNVQEEGFSESLQLRMFPNHRGIMFEGRVHEQALQSLERKGIPTFSSDAAVLHHGYHSADCIIEKLKRNRQILERELVENPDNLNALFFLSKTMRGLGEYGASMSCIDRMMELGVLDPALYRFDVIKMAMLEKGTMLHGLGREEEARQLLEQGKVLFPKYVPLIYALGELYFLRKDYPRAFSELSPLKNETFKKEIIPINIPETVKALRNYLGISSLHTGQYPLAKECFQAAIVADPHDLANYHYLSLSEEKAGNVWGAIEACRQGLTRAESDGYLKKRLFLLHVEAGEFDCALEVFDSLNGHGADMDALSARFLIGCRTLNGADINKYYRLLQEELSLPPAVFPENLDAVRGKMGERDEAGASAFFETAISFLLRQIT